MFLIFQRNGNQARLDYTDSVLNNRLYNVCSFFNTRNLIIECITCFFVSLFCILIKTLCKVCSVSHTFFVHMYITQIHFLVQLAIETYKDLGGL